MTESLATLDFEKADAICAEIDTRNGVVNPGHQSLANLARCYQSLRTASKPPEDAETIEPVAAINFLNEAARYFENRNTNGEDMAHWANVTNAETCKKIGALVAELEAKFKKSPDLNVLLARLQVIRDTDPPMSIIGLNELIDEIAHVATMPSNPPAGEEGGR